MRYFYPGMMSFLLLCGGCVTPGADETAKPEENCRQTASPHDNSTAEIELAQLRRQLADRQEMECELMLKFTQLSRLDAPLFYQSLFSCIVLPENPSQVETTAYLQKLYQVVLTANQSGWEEQLYRKLLAIPPEQCELLLPYFDRQPFIRAFASLLPPGSGRQALRAFRCNNSPILAQLFIDNMSEDDIPDWLALLPLHPELLQACTKFQLADQALPIAKRLLFLPQRFANATVWLNFVLNHQTEEENTEFLVSCWQQTAINPVFWDSQVLSFVRNRHLAELVLPVLQKALPNGQITDIGWLRLALEQLSKEEGQKLLGDIWNSDAAQPLCRMPGMLSLIRDYQMATVVLPIVRANIWDFISSNRSSSAADNWLNFVSRQLSEQERTDFLNDCWNMLQKRFGFSSRDLIFPAIQLAKLGNCPALIYLCSNPQIFNSANQDFQLAALIDSGSDDPFNWVQKHRDKIVFDSQTGKYTVPASAAAPATQYQEKEIEYKTLLELFAAQNRNDFNTLFCQKLLDSIVLPANPTAEQTRQYLQKLQKIFTNASWFPPEARQWIIAKFEAIPPAQCQLLLPYLATEYFLDGYLTLLPPGSNRQLVEAIHAYRLPALGKRFLAELTEADIPAWRELLPQHPELLPTDDKFQLKAQALPVALERSKHSGDAAWFLFALNNLPPEEVKPFLQPYWEQPTPNSMIWDPRVLAVVRRQALKEVLPSLQKALRDRRQNLDFDWLLYALEQLSPEEARESLKTIWSNSSKQLRWDPRMIPLLQKYELVETVLPAIQQMLCRDQRDNSAHCKVESPWFAFAFEQTPEPDKEKFLEYYWNALKKNSDTSDWQFTDQTFKLARMGYQPALLYLGDHPDVLKHRPDLRQQLESLVNCSPGEAVSWLQTHHDTMVFDPAFGIYTVPANREDDRRH
ncbi:hypothetical protein [Victivallis sp. Marseille-Q1083]|uniref:hypothetical protein n=1 Tax=Victivallis sp. Marseille-Q1083 TaxID=2717288 RepID=UPI00158A3576|nr:hypothetical protein [Victivallis sp. Marseille-Q1083]